MEDNFHDRVHDIIGAMSEWERGWYHACISTLWWNSNLVDEPLARCRLPVDYFDGKWVITRYSPSGSQKGSEGFYAPTPPPAPDLIEVLFDEDKFRACWAELDYEASISYYCLEYHHGQFMGEIEVLVACTESNKGLPDDWDTWPEAKPPATFPFIPALDKED